MEHGNECDTSVLPPRLGTKSVDTSTKIGRFLKFCNIHCYLNITVEGVHFIRSELVNILLITMVTPNSVDVIGWKRVISGLSTDFSFIKLGLT